MQERPLGTFINSPQRRKGRKVSNNTKQLRLILGISLFCFSFNLVLLSLCLVLFSAYIAPLRSKNIILPANGKLSTVT